MYRILRNPCSKQLARQALQTVNTQPKRAYWPVRYDPFEDFQRKADRIFRDFEKSSFLQPFFRPPLGRSIPLETCENGQRMFKIEVDLPDFKMEDIQVTVKNGEVIIKAKSEHTDGSFKQNREVNYRYSLPKEADIEKVRSLFKTDGRLVIEAPLPKIEPEVKDQEIPIKRE